MDAKPFLLSNIKVDTKVMKNVNIEFLYLEMNMCGRGISTDFIIEEVVAIIAPALEMAGFWVEYSNDIFGTIRENNSQCCSEIYDAPADCRVYEYGGNIHDVPPREMVAYSLLKTIFQKEKEYEKETDGYGLPDTLRT